MKKKQLKPVLAIHYSCVCCGDGFVDEKLLYPRTGCDLCGSSLRAIELREPESLNLARNICPAPKMPEMTIG
jgi:rRNA maturation endonuclease Nob1